MAAVTSALKAFFGWGTSYPSINILNGGSESGLTNPIQGPGTFQGTDAFPVYHYPGTAELRTTFNPYDINMHLNYGPISIYNDDRTIPAEERETF